MFNDVTTQQFSICIYALCLVTTPLFVFCIKRLFSDMNRRDLWFISVILSLWASTLISSIYMDYRITIKTFEHERNHDFFD